MRRWREHHELAEQVARLETALERRALIERAKGILMERHNVDERAAFERLREHARSTQPNRRRRLGRGRRGPRAAAQGAAISDEAAGRPCAAEPRCGSRSTHGRGARR